MADRGPKDPEELLYIDLTENSSVFVGDCPPHKLDHCDLLLDAIDAQLGQLQIQTQKCQIISKEHHCNETAHLERSQSLSKDTGLGSTTQTNETPMSCLDLVHTPTMGQKSERSTGCSEDPATTLQERKQTLDRRTRDEVEVESQREQIIWRLERLLGDTYNKGRMEGETLSPSESICTEDFVNRFRDEMVELVLPESNVHQLDKEVERAEVSDSDQCERREQSVLNIKGRGAATPGNNDRSTETALYSQPNKLCPREELEESLSYCHGGNTPCVDGVEAGEKSNTPTDSHRAEVVRERGTSQQSNRRSPKARCLAGVPLWSFDAVSIDSDLESVCTEQVRQHIHRRTGWPSLIQCTTDIDEYSTNPSDLDTLTQEETEPSSTSGQRSSYGNVQNRRPSVCKAQHNQREKYRIVCSLDDKDTDEEINDGSRRCRHGRPSEKMQSDWAKMRERLSTLRQRCKKEEETLKSKKTLVKEVESSLSVLQQRRKHALHELEQLIKETAKMEERKKLEFIPGDSMTGKDSISCQRQELPRQREPCLLEKQPSVIMSALEREEMDRQLDIAKTELFAEQRRAREKLESMREMLEETCEELQRVTEAESLLRSRCVCLEEKQRGEKNQIKVAEFKVGELQGELGECKTRVGALERMVAQKELQLKGLKETCGGLQAVGDRLRGELQQLKTEHSAALKEAQEQTHRMMEAALQQQKKDLTLAREQEIQRFKKQTKEEKANALKDQALTLTRHIESLKSSIQLKEEKAKTMRDSLEQRRQEAKSREEQLHEEALEKVSKAIEEERKWWEAEKAEAEQQLQHCSKELGAECQHLLLLVEQSGPKPSSVRLPPSSTAAEALANLRALREQLENVMRCLRQELDSQKQTAESLRNDKERELSIQRQQLRMERDQALTSLQERLILEHIEELSSLNWSRLSDGGADGGGGGGGVAVSLRRQLKAKDVELRQVQQSMAQWKEQTAARLACKFQEEFTAELERCKAKLLRGRGTSKTRERRRKPERPVGAEDSQNSVCSPPLHTAAPHSSYDVASFKILHYLQSRVKQLRIENQGLQLEPQGIAGIQSQSSTTSVSGSGHETLPCAR